MTTMRDEDITAQSRTANMRYFYSYSCVSSKPLDTSYYTGLEAGTAT